MVCCTIELTVITTDPLASELADWFEFSFPITVGVRAPVFLFLLVWLDVLLDVDELDFPWPPIFLCATFELPEFVFIAETVAVVATVVIVPLPSCPNTLSDCVTMVSTKLEVVNLLELVELSLGVLRPLLPLLSSVTPFISKLGLALDLLLEFALDLELELFRLPLDFIGVSASFSGDESDEPLSAGIGLYGGIVFTLPPFFCKLTLFNKFSPRTLINI